MCTVFLYILCVVSQYVWSGGDDGYVCQYDTQMTHCIKVGWGCVGCVRGVSWRFAGCVELCEMSVMNELRKCITLYGKSALCQLAITQLTASTQCEYAVG